MNVNDLKSTTEHNHKIIGKKKYLKKLYLEYYQNFKNYNTNLVLDGPVVELGCGASLLKEVMPEAILTDVFKHEYCDQVVDGLKMPFAQDSIKSFFMLNVFHHIPNVELFLSETSRTLKPGGVLYIVDQNVGIISYFVLKYFHNEYFDHKTDTYSFTSINPLSSANGALAWIVFKRDKKQYSQLSLLQYKTHSPLIYWLLGGLKNWSMINSELAFKAAKFLDNILLKVSPKFGSFVTIILQKKN